jgi:hypothetical protein
MQVRNDATSNVELSLDNHAAAWLKSHTINDLRNMACEMKQHGEDAGKALDLIDELNIMAREI